jgi:PDZ domain-containing protein
VSATTSGETTPTWFLLGWRRRWPDQLLPHDAVRNRWRLVPLSPRTAWRFYVRLAPRRLAIALDDIIDHMSRKTASLSLAALLLVSLVCVATLVPMPYVVMSPGVTENTLGTFKGKDVISISGHKVYPTTGHLDLTTVSVTSPDFHPRLPDIVNAWWSQEEIILPREAVYPPDQSVDAVNKQNENEMLDSQSAAIAAGLGEAGIDATAVTVKEVTAGAPAEGVLEAGDVILEVDGTKVDTASDAVDAISSLSPGDSVTLKIDRDDATKTVTVKTAESPDDPKQARIGVLLTDFNPPFDVNIDLGQDIGGPSAGLMFSLGIYDKITPGPLTGGMFIAGTGTIDMNGTVGPIGGIQQKISGAVASGATVFLAPAENCDDALGAPAVGQVNLIKVSTIDDAVQALKALTSGDTASLPRCD